MACKEKNTLWVYIIKRLEKLCQQYQQIKIALSQSLVDTLVLPQRKRKERKKTPFLSKERETFAMHVAVSVIMLEWHFKSQFGAGVKVEA